MPADSLPDGMPLLMPKHAASNRLDVFALEPVAAKSADVASVLFQAMTPQRRRHQPFDPQGSYSGIPESLYVGETPAPVTDPLAAKTSLRGIVVAWRAYG